MIADGVHPGIPFDVYAHSEEWSGRMSPHTLELAVEQTMAHVHADFTGQRESTETKPLAFGSAFHCRMLEPERFRTAYAVGQRCEALTKDGKGPQCSKPGIGYFRTSVAVGLGKTGDWLCDVHSPDGEESLFERLTVKESNDIEGMRLRMARHPVAAMLRQTGKAEVCIAWTCPRTGILCKSRLDKWCPETGDGGLIVDLKALESVNPRKLSNAIEEYGFARAGAMRQDGIEALTGKRPEYVLVCQEKKYPYEIVVPLIGSETMEGARWEVRAALATWAVCVKQGTFPGYPQEFVEIDAPAWKLAVYKSLKAVTE